MRAFVLALLLAASAAASAQLTDIAAAVQQVRELYRGERFDALERQLDKMLAPATTFRSGQNGASAAYWAFRLEMRAPGMDPGEAARIARWKAAQPKSRYTAFAEARYWYAAGWNARGGRIGAAVSDSAWQEMEQYLARAEAILMQSEPALGRTPLWHQLLLAIIMDMRAPKAHPGHVFGQAVRLFPRHYDFYELALTRMTPKWGGNWEEVDRFIVRWSSVLAASEGDSLYARLYQGLPRQGYAPQETRLDWPRMRASLQQLVKRYPDLSFHNTFASYACAYRDREAFKEAMKLVGSQIAPHDWLEDHSHEACLRWAST